MALKDEMPLTAEYVQEKRAEWGNDHVTDMVRRGMRGERSCFYAIEQMPDGQLKPVGTPFDIPGHDDAALLGRVLAYGFKFAGLMQPPPDVRKN